MATALTRWDPAGEMASMRNLMDRLFEQSFGRAPALRDSGEELGAAALGLDVFETNDAYVVKAAVPGVPPEAVEISVDDDVLTIKGEYQHKDEAEEGQYIRRELRWGNFQRSLKLPPTVDADKAEATFENGVLRLQLPKKPEAKSRSFKITPRTTVNGSSAEA